MVPIRAGAIAGRYLMDWDKDSVAEAGFAKIDLLSLPVLDQIEEALDWIAEREGARPDLGRIDPADPRVYDLTNAGQAKGVFLLQSPAQLQIARRLRARTLQDLAYQVALIRPGVGVQGSAVSQFIVRHRDGAPWRTDHPLEARALARTSGVIVWQEQVVQLLMDVGGMSAAEADALRRAFARPQREHWVALQRQRFLEGARREGLPEEIAGTIFAKINGHYMFPESHSHAFAVTAYQAAWLKQYYPLEFFVALVNQQPLGFYPLETLKEDARRCGVPFRNPCLNRSWAGAIPEHGGVRLGLRGVKAVGRAWAERIVGERERHGPYAGAGPGRPASARGRRRRTRRGSAARRGAACRSRPGPRVAAAAGRCGAGAAPPDATAAPPAWGAPARPRPAAGPGCAGSRTGRRGGPGR